MRKRHLTSSLLTPSLPQRGTVSLMDKDDLLIELDLDSEIVIATQTDARTNRSPPSLTTIYVINKVLRNNVQRPLYIEVLKCSLFPSLNSYAVSMAESVLNETLIESVPLEPYDPRNSTDYSYLNVATHTLRNGVREPCIASTKKEQGYFEYRKPNYLRNETERYDNTTSFYPVDCIWGFGKAAESGITRYFANIFDNQTLSLTGLHESKYPSVHLRQLWNNDTMLLPMDRVMKDMTIAMTAVIRTQGTEGDRWQLKGTMFSLTTCMQVKWQWAAVPIVTIALTGAFLILIMMENRNVASDRLWKSSVLATLFCEIDPRSHGRN